ncbi:transposase [Pseudoalteromonas sp. SR44-5]|nr:transposase [Pseudoalteromonas sp. SR44-5]
MHLRPFNQIKKLNGKDDVLTSLITQLNKSALNAKLERHLANEQKPNCGNGSSTKTFKSSVGNFELDTPRDRSGSTEPQFVKKN